MNGGALSRALGAELPTTGPTTCRPADARSARPRPIHVTGRPRCRLRRAGDGGRRGRCRHVLTTLGSVSWLRRRTACAGERCLRAWPSWLGASRAPSCQSADSSWTWPLDLILLERGVPARATSNDDGYGVSIRGRRRPDEQCPPGHRRLADVDPDTERRSDGREAGLRGAVREWADGVHRVTRTIASFLGLATRSRHPARPGRGTTPSGAPVWPVGC